MSACGAGWGAGEHGGTPRRHKKYGELALHRSDGSCNNFAQAQFARIVEKIESMRQSQNQSKQQVEDLFSAMMQKAFRGGI